MELNIGEYALDGFIFSRAPGVGPYVLLESGDSFGSVQSRHQDKDAARGDYKFFGRDYLTPPERTFVIGVDTTNPLTLPALRNVWRADAVRTTPGATSVLNWNNEGVTYRAEGRSRKFDVVGCAAFDPDWTVVEASFQMQHIYAQEDELQKEVLNINAPPTGSGVILPATLPFTLGKPPQERVGYVNLRAQAPSPFVIKVKGPVSGEATNIRVTGSGWKLSFPGVAVKTGQTLTVDTFKGTARVGSTSVTGKLSLDSTLLARLQPGGNTFHFRCSDSTATSTCTLEYRNTYALF